jgi:predicted RNase H-like HicB family nuclease
MNPTDYPIVLIYSKEDQAWLARVDQLPGCVVDGKTPEEALANTKEAIALWIETNTELGRPIPKPVDAQEIEDMHLKAMEMQGQQIQQLVQEAVAHAIHQFQSVQSGMGKRFPNESYLIPSARITNLTHAGT